MRSSASPVHASPPERSPASSRRASSARSSCSGTASWIASFTGASCGPRSRHCCASWNRSSSRRPVSRQRPCRLSDRFHSCRHWPSASRTLPRQRATAGRRRTGGPRPRRRLHPPRRPHLPRRLSARPARDPPAHPGTSPSSPPTARLPRQKSRPDPGVNAMVERLLGRGGGTDGRPTAAPDPSPDVWARLQLARNLKRPHTLELVAAMADEFIELHGDRLFGDDEALVAGLARIGGRRMVVIGQQKGAETDENIRRNFGMPHPEGYRKAIRLMELAERFRLPVVTFVDVPGANPGPESEERGIAESIARSIGVMTRLRTPIVAVITGEGGSGGALAIAVADVVIALENAVYSVISPEGCAAILWRTPDQAETAAAAMKMTAEDQQALGVVDLVISEPGAGAHTDPIETARRLKIAILAEIDRLARLPLDDLVARRYRRYRDLGAYTTVTAAPVAPPERPGLVDRLRDLLEAGLQTIGGPTPGAGRRDDDDPQPPAREEV